MNLCSKLRSRVACDCNRIERMLAMRYVGLDAHLRQSTFCVLDDRGRKIMTRTAKGSWAAVCAELERIAPPFAMKCRRSTCRPGLPKRGAG